METHSSILTWRIPWTEEPGRLHSMAHKELGTTLTNTFPFLTYIHITYVCTHVYVCMCVCVSVCLCIYIYIYSIETIFTYKVIGMK